MSIEKKSLISTLKTTKKANVASAPATNDGASIKKAVGLRKVSLRKSTLRKASVRKAGMNRGKM